MLGRGEGAVPVDAIAHALDIEEIRREDLDGCEGVLLTDVVRSRGRILVNAGHGEARARFSIAHELGHFLMERHVLPGHSPFLCLSTDMAERRELTRHQRQERQANQFAIELLAPIARVGQFLASDTDLRTARALADRLGLSFEAAANRYIDKNPEPLAIVWSKDHKVRYTIKSSSFPWLATARGQTLVSATAAFRAIAKGEAGYTPFVETVAAAWLENPEIELFEQTRVMANGHAVTLLWATMPDSSEFEPPGGPAELDGPGFRNRRG